MIPQLRTLRELQELDLRITRADARIAEAPLALAELDREEEAARERFARAEAALEDTRSARRRAEGELTDAESAVEKYEGQLLGARTNVEYKGLQQQIDATRNRISDIEDRILESMEAADGLAADLAEKKAGFERAAVEIETRRARVREREAGYRARRDELAVRREASARRLDRETLAHYERIRRARGGLGVVIAHDDRCPACHVRLRPQLFEEIRARDAIRSCESCSRILCFEPPAAPAEAPAEPSPEPAAGTDAETASAPPG